MHILISALRFVPGKTYGAEVYFRHMLSALMGEASTHRITVLCSDQAAPWFTETFPGIAVRAHPMPGGTLSSLVHERRVSARLIREAEGDVTFFPFNLMPSVRGPTVLMVHDLVSLFYLSHFPRYRPVFNRAQKLLLSRSIRNARAIVTPSIAVADEIAAYFPAAAGKTTAIPEAVPPLPLDSDIALPPAWAARYLLLQTGAKLPHKSQRTSLEALSLLKARAPRIYDELLLIITGGDAADTAALQETATRFGVADRVIFAGRISRELLGAVAARAYLHLFPTLYEGFGLGVVEALSLGKPFLASDLAVLREVAGGQGVFFAPGDGSDMAAKLITMLSAAPSPIRPPSWNWNDHARQLLSIFASQR